MISEKAEALVGTPDDFNPVLDLIGDARFVLIGEASHGTHERGELNLGQLVREMIYRRKRN